MDLLGLIFQSGYNFMDYIFQNIPKKVSSSTCANNPTPKESKTMKNTARMKPVESDEACDRRW